ncbi:MAG TPA: DNA cytosine methyltransferase [Dokdonella sp.]|nr:DNA cytosine methyltransferase [Dokdonella sp.]
MIRAVDLFAGLGGNSEGARQAGCAVVWAANHWQAAVDLHAANHPDTAHECQDLHQADWTAVPAHDLLLASPSCTGHTPARGAERPHHDAARSTAWAVVSALECHRTPHAIVENVPAFLSWALFPAWCAALHALGYSVASHVIDAADCGVPQHRVRALIVLARSKHPIELDMPKRAHVPAATIVDFDAGRWAQINRPGRAANTLARIAAGRAEHGARFITSYYGQTRGGRSLARPVGTITTRDRWAVIDGDRMRMFTVDECRKAMAFPSGYHLPANNRAATMMLGNAVPPPLMRDAINALRAAA